MTVAGLGQGDAAIFLDGLDAERAVAVAAGEDSAAGEFAAFGGQGAQEDVDRLALAAAGAVQRKFAAGMEATTPAGVT